MKRLARKEEGPNRKKDLDQGLERCRGADRICVVGLGGSLSEWAEGIVSSREWWLRTYSSLRCINFEVHPKKLEPADGVFSLC